jgi:plastocyanin
MRLIRTALLAGLAFGASGPADADVRGTATAAGKPIADAVVWFDAPGAPAATTRSKVVLDQRNLTFSPRVLVVRVGTTVEFPNNDRVFHDVFSFRDGKRFGLGLYPVGVVKHVLFDQPGLSRLFCNIHPNMAAYIMAVDTPYFALSDRQGRFSIPDIPAGSYTYRAWRPGGEVLTGSATVSPGSSLDLQWP